MIMNKWELTRYLIDAKKCVDNIMFISLNIKSLINLSVRDIVDNRLRKFYINLKVVYDKCISKEKRRILANEDSIYRDTCTERDKNYAHKDDNYVSSDFNSLNEVVEVLKTRIIHCFELCKDKLPDVITLDFIDYDRDLYRFINGINYAKEQELMKQQHPHYGDNSDFVSDGNNTVTKKVFYDTKDIKKISKVEDYTVILNAGLTVRKGIQEMQDGCIRINVLFNQNMWVTPNMDVINEMKKMIEDHPELPFLY